MLFVLWNERFCVIGIVVSLRNLPQIILSLIINHVTFTIVSSRNSVRVVLLIARGGRGMSLPRVSIRKGIQRRRC